MKKYELHIKRIKQLIKDLPKLPEDLVHLQNDANEMVPIAENLEKALTTDSPNKFEHAIELRNHLDNFINNLKANSDKNRFDHHSSTHCTLQALEAIQTLNLGWGIVYSAKFHTNLGISLSISWDVKPEGFL